MRYFKNYNIRRYALIRVTLNDFQNQINSEFLREVSKVWLNK